MELIGTILTVPIGSVLRNGRRSVRYGEPAATEPSGTVWYGHER